MIQILSIGWRTQNEKYNDIHMIQTDALQENRM